MEKAGWTPGTKKIIIVFGDAPPHAEDNGLSYTYGLCKKFHEQAGRRHLLHRHHGRQQADGRVPGNGHEGGGEAISLDGEHVMMKRLVLCVFGSRRRRRSTRSGTLRSWAPHQSPLTSNTLHLAGKMRRPRRGPRASRNRRRMFQIFTRL